MSLNTYQENSQIPEVRKEMGLPPMEKLMKDPSFMSFLLQMLRQRTLNPDPPMPTQITPAQPNQPPPPPNAMPGGGGFNPNNRPGMQGL